jgi:probable phosphoglycerate mutase
LRLEPEITRALNEIDMGELDGKGDPEALQKHREIYNAWIDDHEYEKRSPGGESFLEVQERFIPFIKSLTVDSAQKNDTNFLMVSHGGILLSMLPILLDNISSEYAWSHRLANGGIVIAEAAKGKITCLKWENESFAQ